MRVIWLCLLCLPLAAQYSSYIGVHVQEVTAQRAEELHLDSTHGAEVVRVDEGSPAESAGIRKDDILMNFNGVDVATPVHLGRLVSSVPPGRSITVRYWRAGHIHFADVVPASGVALPMDIEVAPDVPNTAIVWRNRILGCVTEPLDPQMADFFGVKTGLLVRWVDKGALGDISGLHTGDVIQSSADRPITNSRDLTFALLTPGGALHPAKFNVMRNHKLLVISVRPQQ